MLGSQKKVLIMDPRVFKPKLPHVLKTGSVGNNPGFQSKPRVAVPAMAVSKQQHSIKKKITGTDIRSDRPYGAQPTKADAVTKHLKDQQHALKIHKQNFANTARAKTNPAKPHNPQNAGDKNPLSVFEDVKPKKYKKAPNYKDKQIMGLNATFGGNNQSQGDTTGVTTNPYESARYNIPFDRAGSDDKPIGLDKDLESKDTTKQLKRRKAMKLVKAYVDEEGIGGEGTSGGWGAENAGDPGASASGGQNYTLAKTEKPKPYKKAKTFKAMKESLTESGFVDSPGAGDVNQGAGDGFPTADLKMDTYITTDSPNGNEKRKIKKKVAKEEIEVSLGTTGKRKKVFSTKVPIRMADGSIRSLPPGKSGSSGH